MFLQLAQILFATAIGECNQSMHKDASFDCLDKGMLQLGAIEAEDHDFDPVFGFSYPLDKPLDTVAGLNKKLHARCTLSRSLDAGNRICAINGFHLICSGGNP
jgi:hypothetical protein